MALDVFQQVFSFAMLADLVNDQQGTLQDLQQDLQEQLTCHVQDKEGWQLAWGPTIWKLKPNEITHPANSWYIAYHPSAEFEDGSVHPTYVIAIAGTPMGSTQVIEKEDNAVDTVVNFNAWVTRGIRNEPVSLSSSSVSPGIPYFATGTAWGTFHLVNTKSSEHAVSPGKTIVEYLSTLNPSPSTRFIVTGHSLGGCLTTSLSLTLVSTGILHPSNTLTYPVAGPSAGNVEWAHQFAENFPPRKSPDAPSYQGWNLNLVNNLDVIPQLWCHSKDVSPQQWIGRIPTIYGTPIIEDVGMTATKYGTSALSSGVVYKPVPGQYFDAPPPTRVPTTVQEYLAEVMVHHCISYVKEVGITPEQAGLGPGRSRKASSRYPVAGGLQRAVDNPEDHRKEYDNIKDTAEAQALHGQLV